jgi:hypothetical protein
MLLIYGGDGVDLHDPGGGLDLADDAAGWVWIVEAIGGGVDDGVSSQ